MHTALLHRSKRLWLLVSTLLVLVQPAAPVTLGLVKSLEKPGGNITGL